MFSFQTDNIAQAQEILKDILDNYNDLNLSKNYRFEDITKYTAERNMEDLGRYGFTHTFSDKDNVLMLKTLRLSVCIFTLS